MDFLFRNTKKKKILKRRKRGVDVKIRFVGVQTTTVVFGACFLCVVGNRCSSFARCFVANYFFIRDGTDVKVLPSCDGIRNNPGKHEILPRETAGFVEFQRIIVHVLKQEIAEMRLRVSNEHHPHVSTLVFFDDLQGQDVVYVVRMLGF